MINALAAFGLGYLFFKFVQESNGAEGVDDSASEEPQEETTPPTPYDTGKPQTVLTSVYEKEGRVLYKLETLQGQAYTNEDGTVLDETNYQTVGFVVGDVSRSSFQTQNTSRGAFTFTLNGQTFKDVVIYTESEGKTFIDEKANPPPLDPTDPRKKPPEEEPTPPTSPLPPTTPLPGMGDTTFGTFKGMGGAY